MMPNADTKELQEIFFQTRRDLQEWPENLADKGSWKVLPFVVPVYKNGKLCGKKTKFMQKRISDLLKKIPFDVISAGFSILSAQTQLMPHRGWSFLSNNVLRCHFGVCIPPKCAVVVDSVAIPHKQDEWICFDDSCEHFALNFSASERVVFLVDVKRPAWVTKGSSDALSTAELKNFIDELK